MLVPAAIVYDRTKTVVKRHVRPGVAVPLHPDAAAFSDHYGFTPDVLAAYRPTGKGRVGKDCLVSFEARLYSVPAIRIRAGQQVEVRAGVDTITIHTLPFDTPSEQSGVLAMHPRATRRGSWSSTRRTGTGCPTGTPAPPPPTPASQHTDFGVADLLKHLELYPHCSPNMRPATVDRW